MALESATWINELNESNPTAGDPKSQGDDHIRMLKHVLLSTFPSVTGAITPTQTEINYLDGVTSPIQGQFNAMNAAKANLDSPAFTGTPTAPTASTGSSGTQIATLDFVNNTASSASLPGQAGNNGKFLQTDGSNASWSNTIDVAVVGPSAGTFFATTTAAQTLNSKTLTDPIFADNANQTKRANFILSGITAGQNRGVTLADEDMTLFTPYARLLASATASNSATVDFEIAFDSTYDLYFIEGYAVALAIPSLSLAFRVKKGGSYLAGTAYEYRDWNGNPITGQPYVALFDNTGTAAPETLYFKIVIPRPFDTNRRTLFQISGANTDYNLGANPVGICTTTGALQGVRFLATSGNITEGIFKLYGVRKT